jgi:IS1 family transposase
MAQHMTDFLELVKKSNQKELDKRLLYLQVQSIESENSENKERLDAMNRWVKCVRTSSSLTL